ncbi:unnamed protein product [Allacma fusca]|uniref:BED-type domain-containing protein n=1 Tax=Allacma fusca TaxID=39272 RepID=A0A8J2NR37_9HEXA|nr:unnamed protein product [Allacma fusca]
MARIRKNAAKAGSVLKSKKTYGLLAKRRAKQQLLETKTRHGKKTSEVWNYFSPMAQVKGENPTSLCNICGVVFKCPGGSTTGMRGHLERKHPGLLSGSPAVNTTTIVPASVTLEDKTFPRTPTDGNALLANSFSDALLNSSPNKAFKTEFQCEETVRNMAFFCIMDLKPLSTVEGDGFRGMLSHFDQNYILASMNDPDSIKTVAQCVDELYDIEFNKMKKELTDKYVCLTVETWAKSNVEKYVTTTAHYVNESWKLESRFLTVRLLPDPLSNNLDSKETLFSTVMEGAALFGIKSHFMHSMVIYSDMHDRAETEGEIIILPCLNQVVKKCFENLKKATTDIFQQDVFCKCVKIAEKYLPEFETLSRNPYNLLIALLASRMYLEQREKQAIPWDYLPALATLLSPLNDVIEISLDETSICGCISISTVFPLMFALKDQLDALQDDIENFNNEKPFVPTFVDVVMSTFGEAYGIKFETDDFSENIICVSAFLDPRYKALKFVTEAQRQSIYDATIAMLTQFQGDSGSKKRAETDMNGSASNNEGTNDADEQGETSAPKLPSSSKLSGFLMRVLGKKKESESSTETTVELQHYLNHQIPAISTDPLAWWQSNSAKYPNLSIVAMKFLGVAANSSRAEHVFSKLGPQYDRARCALESDYLEKLLFLNKTFTASVAVTPTDTADASVSLMTVIKCEGVSHGETETGLEDSEHHSEND